MVPSGQNNPVPPKNPRMRLLEDYFSSEMYWLSLHAVQRLHCKRQSYRAYLSVKLDIVRLLCVSQTASATASAPVQAASPTSPLCPPWICSAAAGGGTRGPWWKKTGGAWPFTLASIPFPCVWSRYVVAKPKEKSLYGARDPTVNHKPRLRPFKPASCRWTMPATCGFWGNPSRRATTPWWPIRRGWFWRVRGPTACPSCSPIPWRRSSGPRMQVNNTLTRHSKVRNAQYICVIGYLVWPSDVDAV